ncbi:tRNA (N(6)-L-threonylcarbamoyladenosine(37)-C(2))-methylthiotransferase MtaB [bacterium]|nr:tRNA (N(6)-L-threonylcarbamoyladenosine(37)-C(2))-methylthiotransferase MtaB [bacterium]
MKYYRIITLGCKVNTSESMAMAEQLEEIGYRQATTEEPDLILINTCTVTGVSDAKSRQMINREHRKHPKAILVVAGCYSQLASEVVSKLRGVKIVIGTQYRKDIASLVQEYEQKGEVLIRIDDSLKITSYEPLKVTSYNDNTRAFLKIQDGCNNFCSFCIIPYARGPMRSRPKEDIIEEAQRLVVNGFKELVLTGIHTAAYGSDLKDYNFTDLLKELLQVLPKDMRIRISSIEESEISDEFIDLLTIDKRIVPHLHIPLQSGSNSVLKRMNRRYNCEEFAQKIKRIREKLPLISISTDVIVGFPMESEAEFNETYNFIKKLNFSFLHVFPYSKRLGTKAAQMEGQIEPDIKKKRVQILRSLSIELAKNYALNFVGQSLDVLFESLDSSKQKMLGYSPNYLRVAVKANQKYLNEIKEVIIVESGYPHCYGQIKEE